MALAAVDARAQQRHQASASRLLHAPATWVAAATIILVASFLAAQGPALDAWLGDTDDALRLLTVRELMAGSASWFDTTLARVGAPEALVSHWSRLVDAPLAVLMTLLAPVLGPEGAELATRALWPVVPFVALAFLVAHAARAEGGTWAMAFSMLFVGASALALTQFRPGRIDHHNVQILCAVGGIVLLVRAFRTPRLGLPAGILLGLGLAVGYEAIALVAPVLAAACALALLRPAEGRGITDAMIAAAATLLLALLVTTAPSRLSIIHCDALSLNLAALAGAVAAGMWSTRALRLPLAPRLVIVTLAVGGGSAIYASLEPACLAGPFGQVNPALKPVWLDHVSETQSIFALLARAPGAALAQVVFLAAGTAAAVFAWHRRPTPETALPALASLVAALLGCWQMKLLPYATWIVALPLAVCIARLPGAGTLSPAVTRIAAFVLLSQTTLTALSDTALAPFAKSEAADASRLADPSGSCYRTATIAQLASLRPGLVAADIDLGPYVAALTVHRVVAAPYHRLGQGILALAALQSGTETAARAIIARLGVDYIATCTDNPGRNPASFRSRLLAGTPLSGIEEIPLDAARGLRAWRVVR